MMIGFHDWRYGSAPRLLTHRRRSLFSPSGEGTTKRPAPRALHTTTQLIDCLETRLRWPYKSRRCQLEESSLSSKALRLSRRPPLLIHTKTTRTCLRNRHRRPTPDLQLHVSHLLHASRMIYDESPSSRDICSNAVTGIERARESSHIRKGC